MQKTRFLAHFTQNRIFFKILFSEFFNSFFKLFLILSIIVPNFKNKLMNRFQATLFSEGRTHTRTLTSMDLSDPSG